MRLRDVPRRDPADMAQIMATWQEDGVVRQQRIAVHPGLPTAAELDRFIAQAHAMGTAADAVVVYAGDTPTRRCANGHRPVASGSACAASSNSRACWTCAATSPPRPPG
ncbi:hypothetical protein NKH18_11275 [Streptomyces sp. M10(2022)]